MALKVLLVGGGGAIGSAICREAHAKKHLIVATTRRPIATTHSPSDFNASSDPHIRTVHMDVRDESSVDNGVKEAVELLGGLDAVIYAPAVTSDALLHSSNLEAWQTTFDVNLLGAVRVVKSTIKHFLKSKNGTYQFVSSTAALRGSRGAAPYACSKAALEALARNIAIEYGRYNVRAYSIQPGFVDGGMLANLEDATKQNISRGIALQRFAEVAEVAAFSIATLESATYLSGTSLAFDGGGHV